MEDELSQLAQMWDWCYEDLLRAQEDTSLADQHSGMCVVRNLSAIVLRSVDGSCVLSLSCTYGSEHRTGIVNSPDGGFAFVDNIFCPQRSRLSRRIVCHVFIPLRALTIALHSAIFLVVASRNWNMMTRSGEKILTCMAPSRVILDAFPNSVKGMKYPFTFP